MERCTKSLMYQPDTTSLGSILSRPLHKPPKGESGQKEEDELLVGPDEEGVAHYCLTSTIMLSLTTDSDTSGTFNLSGSIRRQMKADLSVEDGHLCNMGKMIRIRGKVYFGKTKEMVCTLRPPSELLSMTLPDSRNP
ncbi:probable F-actin-capping protein subunit beta [Tanacetum coccineum]